MMFYQCSVHKEWLFHLCEKNKAKILLNACSAVFDAIRNRHEHMCHIGWLRLALAKGGKFEQKLVSN